MKFKPDEFSFQSSRASPTRVPSKCHQECSVRHSDLILAPL